MRLELEGGGDMELVACDGEHAVLSASRPFPPGASAIGLVSGEPPRYTLKVRACRGEGERFRLEGRFVNLSRAQRTAALAAVADGTAR